MRLIDADEIRNHKYVAMGGDLALYKEGWNDAIDTIVNNAPTVDAEPVVRCKECKWGTPHPEGDEYTKCFKLCTTFFSGHYCAWGERREDDYEEPDINPCRGCEDYDGKGGCLSHGGCGERREDE